MKICTILEAVVSNNSSSSEPSVMFAYMWWADTTAGLLKQRNSANNAWISHGVLATANLGHAVLADAQTFTVDCCYSRSFKIQHTGSSNKKIT